MVMGTTLEITVYRPTSDSLRAADDLEAAYQEIRHIDESMSLYREDSELVRLNARAGQGGQSVSADLFDVLSASDHYARLSDGAFDISIQPLVDLWGFYDVSEAAVPSRADVLAVMARVGHTRISLLKETREAALELKTGIDLGAIAKGYAIDKAIAVLRQRKVPAALINLGGNVGVVGLAPGQRPWVIGIRHPRNNQLIAEVSLTSGAVSTSGDYDRYFEVAGHRYSHILDPRMGQPVEHIYSLTVLAPNATTADALSTAAFVLGAESGLSLLSACDGIEGILIQPNDEGGDFSVLTTNGGSALGPVFTFAANMKKRTKSAQGTIAAHRRNDCLWPIGNEPQSILN